MDTGVTIAVNVDERPSATDSSSGVSGQPVVGTIPNHDICIFKWDT